MSAQVYPALEDDHWIWGQRLYDYDVLFLNVLWKDWEPTPGNFDTQNIESKLAEARGVTGKRRLVIRFQVMDDGCPDEAPTWLDASWKVVAAGGTSACPRTDCSTSWSLNWSLEAVRARHSSALLALGRWVESHREAIAWVELGSYGFWGEWHHYKCDAVGFAATDDPEKVRAWRLELAHIVDAYFCAFPSTPLAIAFDALKIGGLAAPIDDPVRSRLRDGAVGLYFDALGNEDEDFLKYVDPAMVREFAGPFGGEFQGDQDEAKGSISLLNEKDEASWARTERLVKDFGFQFIRQGGADLLAREFNAKLSDNGRHRFESLLRALAANHEAGSARLKARAEPRVCNPQSGRADGADLP